MADTVRAFIAIELKFETIAFIQKFQDELKSYGLKAKWITPKNIHLTLKFLGDINSEDVKKAGDALISATGENPAILLRAKGIGVFPGIKRPRILWAGITGQTKKLLNLQKILDDKLQNFGFPKEKRPFKGHLTIARIKKKIDAKRLIGAMKEFSGFESNPFMVDEVVLFQSELKPSGAVYTKLLSAALAMPVVDKK